jgi:predicted GNAT superfamily acetyltransferase
MKSAEDYLACVELQKETWGEDFADLVPATILMVSQKIGGVTAGAFDSNGKLLGFVFGLVGHRDNRPIHWSDLLAVREEFRNSGLGKILKLYQRELVLEKGVEEIYWTYDPLVAKNAHLNLNKLGAEVDEYVVEMYTDTGSKLHMGLGMDRFIVVWRIATERVRRLAAGEVPPPQNFDDSSPVVNSRVEKGTIIPLRGDLPVLNDIRVEIPSDIHAVRTMSPVLAKEWRESTRRAFVHYLANGYKVQGFRKAPDSQRCFYYLKKSAHA